MFVLLWLVLSIWIAWVAYSRQKMSKPHLCDASDAELSEVRGVGKQLAKRLRKMINQNERDAVSWETVRQLSRMPQHVVFNLQGVFYLPNRVFVDPLSRKLYTAFWADSDWHGIDDKVVSRKRGALYEIGWRDVDTVKVVYVGKTARTAPKRIKEHRKRTTKTVGKWIEEQAASGVTVVWRFMTTRHCDGLEYELLKQLRYGRTGFYKLNSNVPTRPVGWLEDSDDEDDE